MENNIYVQFYTDDNSFYINPIDKFIYLSNGFSSSYYYLKNKGEFIWIKELNIKDAIERKNGAELPITNGIVYVSCWYYQHLIQVEMWARKYPEVKFIVGGPVITFSIYNKYPFPKNVEKSKEVIKKSKWNITFPDIKMKDVCYSYAISDKCYWGKCLFCVYTDVEKDFVRDGSDLEIRGDFNHHIWLYQPSISPQFLIRSFPKLRVNANIYYRLFFRCDEVSYRTAGKSLKLCENNSDFDLTHFLFGLGIEFPSNGVLKWMNKGVKIDSILKTIKLLTKYGCEVMVFLILGLPITKKDYDDAMRFLDKIEDIFKGETKPRAHILPYTVFDCRSHYDEYKNMELYPGTRPSTNLIRLSKEQKEMNDKIRDRYYECFTPFQDYYTHQKGLLW